MNGIRWFTLVLTAKTHVYSVEPSRVWLGTITWVVFKTHTVAVANTVICTFLIIQFANVGFTLLAIGRLRGGATGRPRGD